MYVRSKELKRAETQRWYYKNHDAICERRREKAREVRQELREQVFSLLGNRCANPNCRHLNLDGTLGCVDKRLLHIDHVNGGGNAERKQMHSCVDLYKKILLDDTGYRLLCAQCNWLRRYEEF